MVTHLFMAGPLPALPHLRGSVERRRQIIMGVELSLNQKLN